MLEGALLGLIVGGVIAYMTWQKNKKRGAAVLLAFAKGGKDAALKELNEQTPAMPALKPMQLVAQQERMAALAIIGEGEAIMREIKLHRGKLSMTAQVHGIALLGARLRGVREASAQLTKLARQVDGESSVLMRNQKKKLRIFADLASALDDASLTPELAVAVQRLIASEGPMASLVVMAALAKAIDRTGGDARELRSKLRESTRAFDRE